MIHRRPLLFALRSLVLLALCALPFAVAHGQSTTATLSGTVTDQNGAVVPAVEITVENIGTALKRQTTTNDEGNFTVPLLPPSTYSVTAQRTGFTPVRIANVVLNVGDQKSLPIHLKAGNISEMVQITNDAPLINESPAVGTVVDRKFVENIPLNGRSFQTLITLTPGVVLTKATGQNAGQFSVSGQRPNANYFTIDGVSANIGVGFGSLGQAGSGSLPGFSIAGGTNNLVSVDALQEFRIETSTYAPEFGRTPGGQVQIATRSGASDFHGAAFEYFRNDALDANDWFNNKLGLPKPAERQNDFGGTFSGPIMLPRFGEGGHQPAYNGRNRTFFFFSYEGLRLRQPQTAPINDVPSLAARQSASSQLRPFLDAFPLPNGPDRVANGLPNGLAQFSASFSNPVKLNATAIRIDHTVSSKLSLFGRYNYAPSDISERGLSALSVSRTSALKTQTLTAGATLTLNPTFLNEIRVNWSKNDVAVAFNIDNFGGAVAPPDSLLFPSPFTHDNGQFILSISGGSMSTLFAGDNANNSQRQVNVVDNVSVVAEPHHIKFGVDYRRLFPVNGFSPYSVLDFFTGVGLPVPSSTGTFLSGKAASISIGANDKVYVVANNFSAYGQDTWQATRRLTLTYGLRWEVNPAPHGGHGQDLFTVRGLDNPSTLALAPQGTPLYETTYNNFAPRVGAAYRLLDRKGLETIVRGGFGIFYDLGTAGAASDANFFPYRRSKSLPFGTTFPITDPAQAAPPPFALVPSASQSAAFDPKLKLPRTYQWNFAIEQSLGNNQTVSASYVGSVGRHLLRQELLRNPNPSFSTVSVNLGVATSDYHSLQVQYNRRLSRGLQVLASYTWAHSIDTASDDVNNNALAAVFNPNQDRGPSDFDVRHTFTAAAAYDVPALRSGKFGRSIFRDWSVDSLVTARSATPVNVIGRSSIILSGQTISASFRPDLITGVPLFISDPTVAGGRKINPAAFVNPLTPRQGTLGRNALRGFPSWQIDLALQRRFRLTERLGLQFRTEFFNVLNHPNFADPNNQLSIPSTFGQSTQMLGRSLGSGGASGFSPLYQIGGPRSIQFALKIQF